jgi:hypothetical protein
VNIYLLKAPHVRQKHGALRAAVVIAKTEEEARQLAAMHRGDGDLAMWLGVSGYSYEEATDTSLDLVCTCVVIGVQVYAEGEPRVVCADFWEG